MSSLDDIDPNLPCLQISDFENIEWDLVLDSPRKNDDDNGNPFVNGAASYLVRKGLSRKAQLALQIRRYTAKHPQSIFSSSNTSVSPSFPHTLIIETWSAFEESTMDFGGRQLDFGVMNTMDSTTREKLDMNLYDVKEFVVTKIEQEQWRFIIKPSVTNKGANINVVTSWEGILDVLEYTEGVREWVLQRYIENPCLVFGHKFHLRVYIVCIGALKVYVYNDILMLIAAHRYDDADIDDVYAHLTNTARSVEDINFDESKFVKNLNDLRDYLPAHDDKEVILQDIRSKINAITCELFAAYENEYTIFAPMPGCFEVYGLDFMVDTTHNVSLLEVNPGPDFKQTGDRLKNLIVQLWEGTCALVIDNTINETLNSQKHEFTKVYDKEASTSKLGGGGMKMQ
jgi:tubulin---tyrosine ligase